MKKLLRSRLSLFLAVLSILIAYRIWVLFQFGVIYTDQDQAVLWEGVMNFSSGLFHETRYYGQAYNTMLEALLATPLYLIGVPVYIALPTVTVLLALLPFFCLAYVLYFKRKEDAGLLVLLIPLLLPIEYDLITTMPRGFVTGLAFVGIASLWLESKRNSSYYLFGLFIVLGFTLNPNSILLSLPLALIYFLKNLAFIRFYFYGLAGLLSGLLAHLTLNRFYSMNPNYELHRPISEFSTDYFLEGIEKWNLFFGDVTPLFWGQGFFVLIITILSAVYFLRKRKFHYSTVAISLLPVILLPLFNSRLYNAADTVFYSYSRMYLAVPLLFGLLLYLLHWKKIPRLVLLPLASVVVFKFAFFPEKLDQRLNESTYILVRPVQEVLDRCAQLEALSKEHQVDLIIINDFGHIIENYTCGICTQKAVKTLYPSYERRTWRLVEDRDVVYSNILVIDGNLTNEKGTVFQELNDTFYLIKDNKQTTYELMLDVGIYPREF